MNRYFVTIVFSVFIGAISAQEITSEDVIASSIQYHDPSGRLVNSDVSMSFIGTRPGGEASNTSIDFNIEKEIFTMKNFKDSLLIESTLYKDKSTFVVGGQENFSNEIKEKYRLNPERLVMMKNYYQYLWLMPMKLNDPGTIIDPKVSRVDFFGKDLLQVRISYSPAVGKDIWYFYFNPNTYAMEGYRFYHDESKNDGEYIILDGESIFNDVRLPKNRTWYTHREDKLLGTDILDKLSF